MNERIKSLADQARVKSPVFTLDLDTLKMKNEQETRYNSKTKEFEPLFTNYIDSEKFAELIVRECVGVADDYVKDCTCDEHIKCKHLRSAIGRKIQEHFGIEDE